MEVYFIFLLLVWLPCAFYSGATAKSKGHSEMEWGIGGLLFGPIALVAAAGLGDHKIQRYQRFLAEAAGYQNCQNTEESRHLPEKLLDEANKDDYDSCLKIWKSRGAVVMPEYSKCKTNGQELIFISEEGVELVRFELKKNGKWGMPIYW